MLYCLIMLNICMFIFNDYFFFFFIMKLCGVAVFFFYGLIKQGIVWGGGCRGHETGGEPSNSRFSSERIPDDFIPAWKISSSFGLCITATLFTPLEPKNFNTPSKLTGNKVLFIPSTILIRLTELSLFSSLIENIRYDKP